METNEVFDKVKGLFVRSRNRWSKSQWKQNREI